VGYAARVARIRDPKLLTKIDERLAVINEQLGVVQRALIDHAQDGRPVGEAARQRFDVAFSLLLKLRELFRAEIARQDDHG
jgi:hypothetical protein